MISKQQALLAVAMSVLLGGMAAGESWRYIRPDEKTGASAAVIAPDLPMLATGQVFPARSDGRLSDSAEAQIEQVLDNLNAGLTAAGASLQDVARLNVYLAEDALLDPVQAALARRYSGHRRPAVTYAVTPHADARVKVSLDAVALLATPVDKVFGVDAPAKLFPIRVIPAGGRIYVAGQAENSEDLAEATRKTLASLRATLEHLGRGDGDVLSLKAFVNRVSDAALVQAEIAGFYGGADSPPLSLVEWKSSVSTPIEIELVAWGGPADRSGELQFITPPGMTASPVFSRVTRTSGGQTVYLSSLWPTSAQGEGQAAGEDRAAGEVRDVFRQLVSLLDECGSDLAHLAKATYYVASDEASLALNKIRPEYYDPQRPPAASKAMVRSVGRPSAGLVLDMIAVPVK